VTARTRKVAFTGAAVLLLGLTLLIDTRGTGPSDPQRAHAPSRAVIERTPAPTTPTRPPTGQAAAARTVPTPSTARREREPRRAPAVSPGEGRAAATAARFFLRAYLPYSYGLVSADRLRGAAPPLVRALREAPPRVAATGARARPRLLAVFPQADTDIRDVLIVAAIDDGRLRYDVRLTVHHGADRWVVTEISG
jgi:hypothetical protein